MKEGFLSQNGQMCHRCYMHRKSRRADCIMGNPTAIWLTKTICDVLLSHLSASLIQILALFQSISRVILGGVSLLRLASEQRCTALCRQCDIIDPIQGNLQVVQTLKPWLDFSSSPHFGMGMAVCLLCQGFGVCKGSSSQALPLSLSSTPQNSPVENIKYI